MNAPSSAITPSVFLKQPRWKTSPSVPLFSSLLPTFAAPRCYLTSFSTFCTKRRIPILSSASLGNVKPPTPLRHHSPFLSHHHPDGTSQASTRMRFLPFSLCLPSPPFHSTDYAEVPTSRTPGERDAISHYASPVAPIVSTVALSNRCRSLHNFPPMLPRRGTSEACRLCSRVSDSSFRRSRHCARNAQIPSSRPRNLFTNCPIAPRKRTAPIIPGERRRASTSLPPVHAHKVSSRLTTSRFGGTQTREPQEPTALLHKTPRVEASGHRRFSTVPEMLRSRECLPACVCVYVRFCWHGSVSTG